MKVRYLKPIRECGGCALNLGHRCGLYPDPAAQWKHRRCEGFNSPSHVALYEKMLHPDGAKARRVARVRRAASAHTVDHRDGRHPLSGVK